jgi:hypothetical protein
MNDGLEFNDPARPNFSTPLANVCFGFGLVAVAEAIDNHSAPNAVAGCLLFVAGAYAWHLNRRARKRDLENAERKNNSNPTR